LVHLCVLGAAVVSLPIGLPAAWSEPPAGDAYWWLMGLLVAGVGLPFFAISANAPLLQACSPAPAIRMLPTPISSMAPRISAA
jgi:hypothetical protein